MGACCSKLDISVAEVLELVEMVEDDFILYMNRGISMLSHIETYSKKSRKMLLFLFNEFDKTPDEELKKRPKQLLEELKIK